MASSDMMFSTGLRGLDEVLRGLIPGDNVVFHIETLDDYREFVLPYARHAQRVGMKPIYFTFSPEPVVTSDDAELDVVELNPEDGFEAFVSEIHRVIEANAPGGYYIFDCLSQLSDTWFSDQMLANFFVLTCPYLYDVHALAYFALRKNHHSPHATEPIGSTAQVLLDVYRYRDRVYIQPTKVQQRHSPTMYMLHAWDGEDFTPVTESAMNSEVLTSGDTAGLEGVTGSLGIFHRAFVQAEDTWSAVKRGEMARIEADEEAHALLPRLVTGDARLLELCRRYMDLSDVLDIQRRMIGTGQIGGKAEGMLLARAVLKRKNPRWAQLLESHDSFFVGSDVFYTYLVRNGCWRGRQRYNDMDTLLRYAAGARQRIQMGEFPDYVMRQFEDMLDYFGQSPIIVRSSSLLEDSFGHSFTGRYDSVFCANQGARSKRMEDFLNAVRTVYASCMSEKALRYRERRGLLERDEQMALLIQRVSGAVYGGYFYPQLAGVGFSYNPYVWNHAIDPEAGVLRLVFGMGTRAVDRRDDDYTRLVALNEPNLRPQGGQEEVRRHAQRKVDLLDLEGNILTSRDFRDVARRTESLPLDMVASRDSAAERMAAERGRKLDFPYILTFDKLLNETSFVDDSREMLATLQQAYGSPVDVEFTANFFQQGGYRINLVQCRPYTVRRDYGAAEPPPDSIPPERRILEASGAVIGPPRALAIDRLICVMPSQYGSLPLNERYQVARTVGELNTRMQRNADSTVMLLGPGRWGTTTPSLGVPVRFGEISNMAVLCEIVAMTEDIVPDVSLGAHFLNELVEMDILYLALFPGKEENSLNSELLESAPNRLRDILPESGEPEGVVRVIESRDLPGPIRLHASSTEQRVRCYVGQA